MDTSARVPMHSIEIIESVERIGSHVYEHFQAGEIDFDLCEGALEILTEAVDQQVWLAVPEIA